MQLTAKHLSAPASAEEHFGSYLSRSENSDVKLGILIYPSVLRVLMNDGFKQRDVRKHIENDVSVAVDRNNERRAFRVVHIHSQILLDPFRYGRIDLAFNKRIKLTRIGISGAKTFGKRDKLADIDVFVVIYKEEFSSALAAFANMY